MRTAQIHVGQSLERVQQFLDANAGVVGAANQTDAREQLDAAVLKTRTQVDEQGLRVREAFGEVRNKRHLENVLTQKYMKPMARFARAQLQGVPNYAALTPSGNRLTGARLVNAARSMAKAAVPYAAQISATKFPADFLTQFGKAADAVAASISTASESRRRRAGATNGLTEVLKQGRTAVQTLDSVVSHMILGNAALLAEWRQAQRVTRSSGRRAAEVAPVTSTQEVEAKKAA